LKGWAQMLEKVVISVLAAVVVAGTTGCKRDAANASAGDVAKTTGSGVLPAQSREESPTSSAFPKLPQVLRSYLSVTDCMDRLKFIDSPEKFRPILREKYQGQGNKCDLIGQDLITSAEVQSQCESLLSQNKFCSVFVQVKGAPYGTEYWVKGTPKGPLVDWASSTGYSEKELSVFKATGGPGEIALFRLWAELDSYYNFEFADARTTHYSLKMSNDDNTVMIHGYLAKNSSDASDVLAFLKSGKGQRLCVRLQYSKPIQDASVAIVIGAKVGWTCEGLAP
jgi:hypothetical protein